MTKSSLFDKNRFRDGCNIHKYNDFEYLCTTANIRYFEKFEKAVEKN